VLLCTSSATPWLTSRSIRLDTTRSEMPRELQGLPQSRAVGGGNGGSVVVRRRWQAQSEGARPLRAVQ
jgi:hypothetical protein